MAQLRIDYDGLEENKATIEQARDEYEELIAKIENTVNSINENWEGQAAEAYKEQFEELRGEAIDKITELLNNIAQQLSDVTSSSEQFDSDLAGKIKG